VQKFGVDEKEFLLPIEAFNSFNDFFIRKLKPEARPIVGGSDMAVLPADGRYLVYPNIAEADGFVVKGKKFSLKDLLQCSTLAKRYEMGSMVIARLCPTDYHRFHFPCNCIPSAPFEIKGDLHSVNPLALRRRIEILSHNKRACTLLETESFGKVAFIEVGAMCVGSIHATYTPNAPYNKGDEKGYFSFGGSSLILLFEPNTIVFSEDLIAASKQKMEVLGLMGQSLGRSVMSCLEALGR
jgi:phosphatidylserine decarboxylase